MTTNPYSNPTKHVEAEVRPLDGQSPSLWNPNAAANWSLIFSPAFGAFLHMKNWEALGQPEKAAASKNWLLLSLAFMAGFGLLGAFFPTAKASEALSRIGGLGLLIGWYMSSGRAQALYVAEHYGKNYVHRAWAKPLSLALVALIAFFVVVFIAAYLIALFLRV
jgi:hypothetical protein